MSGIQKLGDIYEKKGAAETRKHITGNITVTEKLDAHRFSFQVNEDKSVSFFKKNDSRTLTEVDRVISDLYERAIHHVNNLPSQIMNNIPDGMRFGFAYFPSEKPLRISYSKFKPKNNLVLTDITIRNKKGKVKKVHEDVNFLNRWADVVNVSRPPILFKGKLDENNSNMLMSVITGNKKTSAFFAEHVESIFGKTYSKNRIIEGIVIKNSNGLSQLRDPSYKIFDAASTQQISRDFYDLTLLQIQQFMKGYQFPAELKEHTSDKRYIEIVSDAYNKFIENGSIDESFDPEFLKPKIIGSHGKLGRKHITNNKTLKLVQNPLNEELYKVFISSFRRKRKAHGLLTEGSVNSFNVIVDRISELANNSVHSFSDYQKIYEADYQEGKDVGDVELKPDSMKVISSLQLAFTHQPKEVEKGEKKVKIIVGNFNPLNNSHVKIAKQVTEEGSRVIFVHISRLKVGYSEKVYQCSDGLVEKMLKRIANDNSEIIDGYAILPYHSIKKLFDVCRRQGTEPIEMIVPEDCGPNYMSQLYMEEQVLGKRLGVDKDFEIKEMKEANNHKVLRAIEDGNYKDFKIATPDATHGFWDSILTEYRAWAGMYPNSIQQ